MTRPCFFSDQTEFLRLDQRRRPRPDVQPRQYARNVQLNRRNGQFHLRGDLFVHQSFGQTLQHLFLFERQTNFATITMIP